MFLLDESILAQSAFVHVFVKIYSYISLNFLDIQKFLMNIPAPADRSALTSSRFSLWLKPNT